MIGSELRAKYTHRFHTQDTDGDGFVDRQDVAARAEMLLAGLGEQADSARGASVIDGATAYWQGVAKLAGIAEEGRLTEGEFVEALVRANELGTIADLLRPSVEAHVTLVDTDGDGTVSLEEFVRAQQAVGMSEDEASAAFDALDRNGDGNLTVEEWQQAVLEFYTTTDPSAPGNLVMGLR
ncbi:EF-hand domain-containing protein [Streptomyces sp. NPDC051214]|uniref:EF-hand domain-containing protein n=1 Tax=Streptomyces sp. NPDC051214 TaxID=3155282 RepID=UPI003445DB6E